MFDLIRVLFLKNRLTKANIDLGSDMQPSMKTTNLPGQCTFRSTAESKRSGAEPTDRNTFHYPIVDGLPILAECWRVKTMIQATLRRFKPERMCAA